MNFNWIPRVGFLLTFLLFILPSFAHAQAQQDDDTIVRTVEITRTAQPAYTIPGTGTRVSESIAVPAQTRLVEVSHTRGVEDVTVLVLSPDEEPPQNLVDDLNMFGGLVASLYPSAQLPTLSGAELLAYDVVVTNNNNQWSVIAPGTEVVVGDALADYIDDGGKVMTFSYAYDFFGWELGGRFITENYGPFELATADTEDPQTASFHQPNHPVLEGASTLTSEGAVLLDMLPTTGAQLLASWSNGFPAIGVNENVVSINLLYGSVVSWTGDLDLIAWNAAMWLGTKDVSNEGDGDGFAFDLYQNYPNPFSGQTTISFELPVASHVTVEVLDVTGRRVALLVDEHMGAASHSVEWNANGFANGVYLYRMVTDGFSKTLRTTLVR